MIPLKSDYSFAWLDDNGMASQMSEAIGGIYHHDIRHLKQYSWDFNGLFELIWSTRDLNQLEQKWIINGHHEPKATIERKIQFFTNGFSDELTITNQEDQNKHLDIRLNIDADFSDLFDLRSDFYTEKQQPLVGIGDNRFSAQLEDETQVQTHLSYAPNPTADNLWQIEVAPFSSKKITVQTKFTNNRQMLFTAPINKEQWAAQFDAFMPKDKHQSLIYQRNVDDFYHLLLATQYGFYPAAGVPIFVTPFGRDGLISANMLLEAVPALAKSVLAYGASIQGQNTDSFREEEPGKIFHEVRLGPLANLNKIPFGRYYGTADATSLWIKLLGDYIEKTNDILFLRAYESHLKTALSWLEDKIKDNGFVQFTPEGRGLANQNWKDSPNSNCHADGKQAKTPIANIEVQAYSYAAFNAAAQLFTLLNQNANSQKYAQMAKEMFDNIQKYFWLDDLQFYAMGLDADLKPLAVVSSNVGHLLWCGAIPSNKAQMIVDRLLAKDMWSGWGLRTLSQDAKAFMALGYHIGSVWPHDTALFALGAAQYGILKPAQLAADALYDMATGDDALSLPEVTGGYERQPAQKPVPVVRSCIPQAWAAAGLIALQICNHQNSAG